MASARPTSVEDDRLSPDLPPQAARLARAAGMRAFAQASCERSRAVLLDDHERRLRMRSWMRRPSPVPRWEP